MDKSAVGLRNPVKLIKLETILVPKRAATKGIILSNLVPPVLLRTKLLALSTISSAMACRLLIFSTRRFRVRKIHSPVIIAITIQLTTRVSESRKSPRKGIPVGILRNIFAPEISKFIL